jgi:cell division protein FtsQ
LINFAALYTGEMAKETIAWKRIILSLAVLGVAVCLFVYIFRTNGVPVCKGIEVEIKNSKTAKLLTSGDFLKLIEQNKVAGKGKPLDDGVIKKTLQLVKSKASVKNATVYRTGDSILHVEIEQRIPVVRILAPSGSCYLDSEGIAFPVSAQYTYDLPLVTGKIQLPEAGKTLKDTVLSRNLLTFADYISKDPFWTAQIQQIDIDENGNVEFAVCSDSHLIRFGQFYGYEKKLDNLLAFYRNVNPYYREKDSAPYTVLDLRFSKLIVAVKKI